MASCSQPFRALGLPLLVAVAAFAADPAPVPGVSGSSKTIDSLKQAARAALPSLRADLPVALPFRLGRLSAAEFPAEVPPDQSLAGIHRALPDDVATGGTWHVLPGGGRFWRLALQSPDAAGIRLHFKTFEVGAGRVWLHDGSRDQREIMGFYTARGPWSDGEFWTDYVMSDTVVVEYEPPAGNVSADVPFRVVELSHMLPATVVNDLAGGKGSLRERAAAALGRTRTAAASCNLDVTCFADWADVARAVGHIVYEKDGSSFVCSGTLMNTRNSSGIPYFLTADHCVNNDAVARTVQSFWLYQTRTCNGVAADRRNAQRVLGATYLGGGGTTQGDFSLLRLTEAPPNPYFAGWNPAELDDNTAMTGIHHPSGDYKRISFGFSGASRQANFYRINYNRGVVQAGSSGSGVFTSNGQLRGVLSSGPKLDNAEEYCSLGTVPVNYGRFPVVYNALRDYFEDRANARPATPSTTPVETNPAILTSGTPLNFSLDPVSRSTLINGNRGFAIRVPQGATRLDIQLTTDTQGVDVDLYARFGSDVALSGSQVVADHRAEGPTASEVITITAASTPPLRAGTYYIALGVFTPSVRIGGRVQATVLTGGGTSTDATVLTSGVARDFTLGPVTVNTLFNDPGYRVVVPPGATSLEIEVQTATRGADVDLFTSFNTPITLQNGRVVAEYRSEGDAGDEKITITASSSPPLRPGTYYIALALFTQRVAVNGTIRATVRTAATTPSGPTRLTSGQPAAFRFDAVTTGTLFRGDNSFVLDVPANARRLVVQLNTTTAAVDLDLFVRFNSDPVVQNGNVVADWKSEGPTGAETITITPASTPALREGRYFISLALFTPNIAVAGTVTATIQTAEATTPPAAGVRLTSGQASRFTLPAEEVPFLHNGDRSFTIEVPSGATKLSIEVRSTVPSVDVDLYVRHDADVDLNDEGVVADFASESESGTETITITPGSNPPLKPGLYYISLAVFTTDVGAAGMITATVERGIAAPGEAPATRPIVFGAPGAVQLPAVDSPTLFTGDYGFHFEVGGGGRLEVQMRTQTPGADVDVFLRYGAEPEIVSGRIIADHRGYGDTGDEDLTVDSRSVPPLRPGPYYIGFAQFTENVASTGQVVVRYTGASGEPQERTFSLSLPQTKGRLGVATRIPKSAKFDFAPLSKKIYGKANRQ